MHSEPLDRVWQVPEVVNRFLTTTRGAMPFARAQLELMLRLIAADRPHIDRFLDLGCGDGILGIALLGQYPTARGVFQDFSQPMLDAAKERLQEFPNTRCVLSDYGDPAWVASVQQDAPFDVIVSGFSIHHQPDTRKQRVYRELFDLLKPGGMFLNLEHVESASAWGERQYSAIVVDGLYATEQARGGTKSREEIWQEFDNRPDKVANILAPVERQCEWLRSVGFVNVDCFFKYMEYALFGGHRPA